jgi:exopolysaccharide production protein ExoY
MSDMNFDVQSVRVQGGDGFMHTAPMGPTMPNRYSWKRASKRILDIVLSSTMLMILAPVMIAIALLVWRDGGRIFFGHPRIGRGGKTFHCMKFRSMVPNAEQALRGLLERDAEAAEMWQKYRKLDRDPRITTVGNILRATSLDELPQLYNVLRGDMSLVGPRPVVQEELEEQYGPYAASYLAVRPGITGLWQVSGRSDTSYKARVALDTQYVQQLSLWRDLKILAKTVPAVLSRRGAR